MRLVICEQSSELITCAPRAHAGEFERIDDAKRCAVHHQEFIFSELAIATEAGDLVSYRPCAKPWIDCVDPAALPA